jgi:hypothetical protein
VVWALDLEFLCLVVIVISSLGTLVPIILVAQLIVIGGGVVRKQDRDPVNDRIRLATAEA